jgi:7-cyano-7-deazaguanine reductase
MADVQSTEYAEGRILAMDDPSTIRPDWLETFSYAGPRQRVTYQMNEFAAVCPFSGLPDTGTVWIEYIPDTKLVELKALKYYLISYRNVGIFQEAVTARLFEDLWKLLEPQWLQVRTAYATRGGIDATCVINSEDQPSSP